MKPQDKVNEIQRMLEKEKTKVIKAIYVSPTYEERKILDRLHDALTRSMDDIRRSTLQGG